MNYKTAMAGVCEKYGNPRTRTHVAAFLARYASADRPVTAWHAVGEDAAATKLLLEGLGFREGEHFTVQASVLDPDAQRFSWTDAGTELLSKLPGGLAETDFTAVQHRILLPGARRSSPAELLRDEAPGAPAEPGDGSVQAPDGVAAQVLDASRDIARRLVERRESVPDGTAVWWADEMTGGSEDAGPIAPLTALEALARLDGVEGLPPHQVFGTGHYVQMSRPVAATETLRAAQRINCLPLRAQLACENSPVRGYFATTVGEWKTGRRRAGCDAVWTQFNAPIAHTAEALNFALDAERMRAFVQKIVEHGYAEFGCRLVDTTRLAARNDFVDDDDIDSFGDDYLAIDDTVYMGAHVLSRHPAPARNWENRGTPPVRLVEVKTGETPDESLASDFGITVAELADEWFAMTHMADGGVVTDSSRCPREDENLKRFRETMAALHESHAAVLALCSPKAPAFAVPTEPTGMTTARPGALVLGVCAALRKYCAPGVEFVENAPFHPDMFVAGVWSGISTDLAPEDPDKALAAGVFPRMRPCSEFGSTRYNYAYDPDSAARMDRILGLLRANPHVQLKFGKRTRGSHRSRVMLIETNVRAKTLVEYLYTHPDAAQKLRQGMWQAFASAMIKGRRHPLDAVDATFCSAHVAVAATAFRAGIHTTLRNRFPDSYMDIESAMKGVDQNKYNDAADAGFGLGWAEDTLGRLVVVISTTSSDMAQAATLVHRFMSGLPLESASYLATHGQGVAALPPGMTDEERYRAVLSTAVRHPEFDGPCCDDANRVCGAFGRVWNTALLGSSETLTRGWYTSGECVRACDYVASPGPAVESPS